MKLTLLAALTLSAMTFSATAQTSLVPTEQQPSFDYVQANYHTYNLDGVSTDLDGYALRGSFSLTEQFFGAVDYEDVSATERFQGERYSVDLRQLYANLGYQFYQHGNTSIYAAGGLAWIEVEVRESWSGGSFSDSDSETGYNLQLGLRHRFNQHLEVDANVRHVDVNDGTDQILSIAGRYYVTPRVSIDARYTRIDSDLSGYSIGASLHF